MYTAPSALPSTSLPSARRAIAVKSVSPGRRRSTRSTAPVGEVDPEVAAAGRRVDVAVVVAGQRGRRAGQRTVRGQARRRIAVTAALSAGRGRAPPAIAVAASNTAACASAGQRAAPHPPGPVDGRRHRGLRPARWSAAARRRSSTSTPPAQRSPRADHATTRCDRGVFDACRQRVALGYVRIGWRSRCKCRQSVVPNCAGTALACTVTTVWCGHDASPQTADSAEQEFAIEDITTGVHASGFGQLGDGRSFSFHVERQTLVVEVYRPRLRRPGAAGRGRRRHGHPQARPTSTSTTSAACAAVRDAVADAQPVPRTAR